MAPGLLKAALIATSLAVSASASPLAAGSYATKPVKLVVGFAPGGPTDIIARVIGQHLSREIGQPVIIENIGGASGAIAARSVALAPPDGYTLLVSVESAQTRGLLLNPSLPYDQVADFAFVRKVAMQRNLIVVNPSVKAATLKELLAYAKAHPGELNAGGTFGATSHLGIAYLCILNDVKVTFIGYSGGAQPITDLMAGVTQVGVFTEATVTQYVQQGLLRALAVASNQRSPRFPDLPTAEEAGAQAMEVSPWFGIVAPAATPPAVLKAVGDALGRMVGSKDFVGHLEKIGAVPIHDSTAENFRQSVVHDIAFWNEWGAKVKAQLPR